MKTISMTRDFTYRATGRVHVQYLGSAIYTRVPEAAVRAILAAKAGAVVPEGGLVTGGDYRLVGE